MFYLFILLILIIVGLTIVIFRIKKRKLEWFIAISINGIIYVFLYECFSVSYELMKLLFTLSLPYFILLIINMIILIFIDEEKGE